MVSLVFSHIAEEVMNHDLLGSASCKGVRVKHLVQKVYHLPAPLRLAQRLLQIGQGVRHLAGMVTSCLHNNPYVFSFMPAPGLQSALKVTM